MLDRKPTRRSHAGAVRTIMLLTILLPVVLAGKVWVHSVVSADHEGLALLPHFINYYHQLGITYKRFLIILHHDPSRHSEHGLDKLTGICQGYTLECRVWKGPPNPEDRFEHQLAMFKEFIDDPLDWIVSAEVDEMQDWGTTVTSAISQGSLLNSSYVVGDLIDRAAAGGAVVDVENFQGMRKPRSLFQQFPLRCRPTSLIDAAAPAANNGFKVIAFRNYLRPSRDGRSVVAPDEAKEYFGACMLSNTACPRGHLRRLESLSSSLVASPTPQTMLASNLFNMTPYYWFEDRYRYDKTSWEAIEAAAEEFGIPLWKAVKADNRIPIHRFRWRSGAINATEEMLQRYSGECDVTAPETEGCSPLLPRWREAAAAHARIKKAQQIDPSALRCSATPPEDEVEIDTSYMGLAWEQFEPKLAVTAKVRNDVKGDSQTRMTAKVEDDDYEKTS